MRTWLTLIVLTTTCSHAEPVSWYSILERSRDASSLAVRMLNLNALIEEEALRAGIRPRLLAAVIAIESGGDPCIQQRLPPGMEGYAVGLGQLIPQTARMLGVADRFDPVDNLRGAASYLGEMLERAKGDEQLAVAAYYAGPRIFLSSRLSEQVTRKIDVHLRRLNEALHLLEGSWETVLPTEIPATSERLCRERQ